MTVERAPTSPAFELQPARLLRGQQRDQRRPSPRPIDLRLDANEGGTFAAEIIGAIAADPELLRRYPDTRTLEASIAQRLHLDPDRVIVTAGADDALWRVCSAMLEPGRRAAFCTPTFEMLRRYVRAAGADAIEVPWWSGPLPIEQLIDAGKNASVVFVVSPNNPTGTVATAEDLKRLRAALPAALLVLDAAYAEFADEDLTQVALALPWTIVTRTLSKSWSAAGLRVGYAIGDSRAIDWLGSVGQPYAVSSISLAFAAALLARGDAASRAYVERVRAERADLTQLLESLGASPVLGQANFVLARFRDAALVADLLEGLGIAVRRFPTEPGLTDSLRIGCPGDREALNRLTRALQAALRPEALLVEGASLSAALPESLVDRLRVALFDEKHPVAEPAWILAQTPRAIRAVRTAGVVPIACLPAGASRGSAEDALFRAGAARVLDNPKQLLEILP